MPSYKANVGIDFPEKRVEAGSIIDDVPAKSVKWLVEQGYIEIIADGDFGKSKKNREPVAEVKIDIVAEDEVI